jgi:hypothetical protein
MVMNLWHRSTKRAISMLTRGTSTAPSAYDIHGDIDDDESGYRFGDHPFVTGEYVSIREHDEDMNTFRVVSVNPLT